eukprot:scaffold2818_cov133-Skeletonema_marinoi.AAC.6
MVRSITSLLIVAFSAAARTNAFVSPTMQQSPTRIPSSITHRNYGPLPSKDANMSEEERDAAMEKALKAMTAFSNKYVQNTNTYYCEDQSVPAVVIKGLAEHKVTLGTPLCPCRFYEDKEKEAKDEDNDFAGTEQNISIDDVKKNCGF